MTDYELYHGDCLTILPTLAERSVDAVITSPPYGIGKPYEKGRCYGDWRALMFGALTRIARIVCDDGFIFINVADVRCYADPFLLPIRANNHTRQRRPTTNDLIAAVQSGKATNKNDLVCLFNCSDQTIDRRFLGNNARGSKLEMQTRVRAVIPDIIEAASTAGLYLYDIRIWVKDPCWESCEYHTTSYRAIDEYEYLLVFSKPGAIHNIDRTRLTLQEWAEWGSRGVWSIASVRINDDHPAMYPLELARRAVRLFSPTEGLVLDPFMGSGTTGHACANTGRRFIGIEQDAGYFAIAEERIATAYAPLRHMEMAV